MVAALIPSPVPAHGAVPEHPPALRPHQGCSLLEVDHSAKTFHFAPLDWQSSFGVPYRAEWSPDGARLLWILKRGVVKGIRQDAACNRLLAPYALHDGWEQAALILDFERMALFSASRFFGDVRPYGQITWRDSRSLWISEQMAPPEGRTEVWSIDLGSGERRRLVVSETRSLFAVTPGTRLRFHPQLQLFTVDWWWKHHVNVVTYDMDGNEVSAFGRGDQSIGDTRWERGYVLGPPRDGRRLDILTGEVVATPEAATPSGEDARAGPEHWSSPTRFDYVHSSDQTTRHPLHSWHRRIVGHPGGAMALLREHEFRARPWKLTVSLAPVGHP